MMKCFRHLALCALLGFAAFNASAANLTTTDVTSAGILSTAGAVAATVSGDSYTNDGRTMFVVTNGGGSPITVTVTVQRTTFNVSGVGTVTFANIPISVTNGTTRFILVPQGPYNDANGRVSVTYSAVTSVTVSAVRVPQL